MEWKLCENVRKQRTEASRGKQSSSEQNIVGFISIIIIELGSFNLTLINNSPYLNAFKLWIRVHRSFKLRFDKL